MSHRGPDDQGVQLFPNAVLGHSRLSIIDALGGHQPMKIDGAGIVFNGEIYNHRDLRANELKAESFQSNSDTEVILRLYLKQGPSMVSHLEGMFAIAIIHQGDLFLARDHLGIKPLYYGWQKGILYFASELKNLATICETVLEFPPGTWFHSRLGWNQYYFMEAESKQLYGVEKDIMSQYRTLLQDAVERHLLADVPVGVSLSGGIDSSIIALLAVKQHPRIESFAVGMTNSPDLAAARVVADHLQTDHYELTYTEEQALAVLPDVLRHLESFDPALVRSAVPNYFLAQLAATRVKVILTGEGADELFAGYDYMERYHKPGDLYDELILTTRSLHNTNLQRADRMSMAFGVEARVPFLYKKMVSMALGIPTQWKIHGRGLPKSCLRMAFSGELPDSILQRPKQKFAIGAGSSLSMARIADSSITDKDFYDERRRLIKQWNYALASKEALYYYRIVSEHISDAVLLPLMGVSRSL